MGTGDTEEFGFDELVYSKFPAPDLESIVRSLPSTLYNWLPLLTMTLIGSKEYVSGCQTPVC